MHPSDLPVCYAILSHVPHSSAVNVQIPPLKLENALKSSQIGRYSTGNGSTPYSGFSKGSNASSCSRHPDKKIKFFCESDLAFLCSKCVIQHTGVGHVIKEYSVNTEKMRTDYLDVNKKYK
jgi:hypothetical protein